MSLTRNDIQILKEVFQPEFANLHKKIEEKIDSKIDSKIDGLKQYVDERFNTIDKRFEQINMRFKQIDERFEQVDRSISSIARSIVDELYEMYTPREVFDPLEKRVTSVEEKLIKHSF